MVVFRARPPAAASPLASQDWLGFFLFEKNHSCSCAASLGSQKDTCIRKYAGVFSFVYSLYSWPRTFETPCRRDEGGIMTLSSPAGSYAASLRSQENRDRTKVLSLFFRINEMDEKGGKRKRPEWSFSRRGPQKGDAPPQWGVQRCNRA